MKKFLYIVAVLILMPACPIIQNNCLRSYCFEAPISITPARSTYKIGDTILVSMDMDNTKIRDTILNRYVKIPNYDPNIYFIMPCLDTLPVIDGFLLNHLIIPVKYSTSLIYLSTLSSGLVFLGIDTTINRSKLDFKIVFKNSGLYCLYAGSEVWRNSRDIDFEGKCGGPSDYSIKGVCRYQNSINSEILSEHNKEVENKYWAERSGQRKISKPFYFRVVP